MNFIRDLTYKSLRLFSVHRSIFSSYYSTRRALFNIYAYPHTKGNSYYSRKKIPVSKFFKGEKSLISLLNSLFLCYL